MVMRKEVDRLWDKPFGRALPTEALAWASIEFPNDSVEFIRRRMPVNCSGE